MPQLSSITIINVDSIPLALNFCGGVALLALYIECPIACDSCPWDANLNSKEAKVLQWSFRVLDILRKLNPDVVVMHGAEPYESTSSLALAWNARSLGIKCAIKVLGRYMSRALESPLIDFIDLIIVEAIDESDLVMLRSLINEISIPYEVTVVIHNPDDFIKLETSIRSFLSSQIPISVIFVQEPPLYVQIKLLDSVRRTNPLTCIPLSPSTELASIPCPGCGDYLVVRTSGITIKRRIRNSRCEICGYPLRILQSKKLFTAPIAEPVA